MITMHLTKSMILSSYAFCNSAVPGNDRSKFLEDNRVVVLADFTFVYFCDVSSHVAFVAKLVHCPKLGLS